MVATRPLVNLEMFIMELNVKSISTIVVTLGIMVLMISTVLVPVVAEASDTVVAEYNNSAGIYAKAIGNDSVHLEYSIVDGSPVWKVNGESVSIEPEKILFLADKWIFANLTSNGRLSGDGYGRQDGVTAMDIIVENNTTHGTVTSTNGTFNLNRTFAWFFYASNDGDYRSVNVETESSEVWINSVDDLYYGNWLYSASTWFSGNGGTVNTGNGTIDAEYTLSSVENVNGVYSIVLGGSSEDLTFTIGDYVTHPYLYIVPAKVSGEKVPNGQTIFSIIQLIPLLVLTGVVIGVVGSFIRNRD